MGDTGIEPVTSSVSATVHQARNQHKHEAPQVRRRRCKPYSAVWIRSAPFGASPCSHSAPLIRRTRQAVHAPFFSVRAPCCACPTTRARPVRDHEPLLRLDLARIVDGADITAHVTALRPLPLQLLLGLVRRRGYGLRPRPPEPPRDRDVSEHLRRHRRKGRFRQYRASGERRTGTVRSGRCPF